MYMKRLKVLLAGAAAMAGSMALAGSAQAATYVCTTGPVCSFDGTTGGFTVRRAAQTTAGDLFEIVFATAGTLKVTLTSAQANFTHLAFLGQSFTPSKGTPYAFNIASSGTYLLSLTTQNGTARPAAFSGTFDFAAVPEPAAWGMMIAGVAMAGAALRRRRAPRVAIA
ncbi:hypothetical protein ATB93_18575 [Sphingomonas sp. WG]|nr:hypothetical protein ATB93_18575 [Sphingomonas sp. WG]